MSNSADGAIDAPAGLWFRYGLLAIVLGGFALRVVYVLISRQHLDFGGDAHFYQAGANLLADGRGFINPYFLPRVVQAADHPPLYMLYLSFFSMLGMRSVLWHLLWSCVLGAGSIAVIGLLGRKIGGARLGLIATLLAALYPNMWIPDGGLLAETMAIFTTALALLFAYKYWENPTWQWLAAVGAAVGAAALARSELILLVPFLVLPLVVFRRGVEAKRRWLAAGAGVLAALVVIAPWVGYNLTRFYDPVTLSTQFGPTLSSANCDLVYRGGNRSYYDYECSVIREHDDMPKGLDPSQQDTFYRKAGMRYISDHKSQVPGIVGDRVLAFVGLYHPEHLIGTDAFIEGRGPTAARWGMYTFYALALAAVAGAIVLRRSRRAPLFPLLAPPVVALLTVITLYMSIRFRATAEVSIVVLAAVAIEACVSAVTRSKGGGDGEEEGEGEGGDGSADVRAAEVDS